MLQFICAAIHIMLCVVRGDNVSIFMNVTIGMCDDTYTIIYAFLEVTIYIILCILVSTDVLCYACLHNSPSVIRKHIKSMICHYAFHAIT